jgi:hypothetical protein
VNDGPWSGGPWGAVGGGGGLRAFRPIFSAAPTHDPGSFVASSSVTGPGKIRVTTQNPGTIGLLPSAMAIWESTTVLDARGRAIGIDGMDIGDIVMPLIRAPNIVAPVDLIIACGVSKGTVQAGNPGVCATLRDTKGSGGTTVANQWTTGHGSATVGAWSQFVSSATDANTIMGLLVSGVSTQYNQSKVSTIGWDVSRNIVTTTNALSSSAGANTVGDWDRVWIGIGYVTGVGGSAQTNFDFGCSLLFLRPSEVVGIDPLA